MAYTKVPAKTTGTGPQSRVFDDTLSCFTAVSVVHADGMVDRRPSPARESSEREVSADHEAGKVPPKLESPLMLSDFS